MKKSALLLPCLLLSAAAWTTAGAQTCASPTVITSNSTFSGDTTGGDTTLSTVCGGAFVTGPINVFTWTNGGGTMSGSLTVTPSNATFDVGLALGHGTSCAVAATTCDGNADNAVGGGAAGAESIALTGLATNQTYFLFVSSFASGGATVTSGPYGGTTGTLPVKLQNFSVN